MRTSGRNAARCRRSSVICRHSSRVGQMTSACRLVSEVSRHSMSGMPNAQVLPVPVGALAMTSRPSVMTGMVCSCTGVGAVKPIFCSAFSVSGCRCSVANPFFSTFSKDISPFLSVITPQYITFRQRIQEPGALCMRRRCQQGMPCGMLWASCRSCA